MSYPRKSYYESLGLKNDASPEDIKRAYQGRVLQYHPDRKPGDAEAAALFSEMQEAFDVLGNSAQKAAYDSYLARTTIALDVGFFAENREAALATLGKYLQNGQIEYARAQLTNDDGRKVKVTLHFPDRAAIDDRDWQELRNALQSLQVRIVEKREPLFPDAPPMKRELETQASYAKRLREYYDALKPKPKEASADLTFYIVEDKSRAYPALTRFELLKCLDENWNELFFKQPGAGKTGLPGKVSAKAARAEAPVKKMPDYFLTQCCVMAGYREILSGAHAALGEGRMMSGDFSSFLTNRLKTSLKWQLIGRPGSDIKYPCLDMENLPPPEGFEDASPVSLRSYYITALASYSGSTQMFRRIDPATGEFSKDSDVYAVGDRFHFEKLVENDLIPKEIENGVNFPPYISKTQQRLRRLKGDEEPGRGRS